MPEQIDPDVYEDFGSEEPVVITASQDQYYYREKESVPATFDEKLGAAIRSWEEGAAVVHTHGIHTRTGYGFDMDVDATRELLERIDEETDAIIQFGLAAPSVTEERIELMETAPVDMLSINCTQSAVYYADLDEYHFMYIPMEDKLEVFEACNDNGVMPEIEIKINGGAWALEYLTRKGAIEPPYWTNLIFGDASEIWSPPTAQQLDARREILPEETNWFVTNWTDRRGTGGPIVQRHFHTYAMLVGGHVRTGVEQQGHLVSGPPEEATASLVREISDIADLLKRGTATPDEARDIINPSRDWESLRAPGNSL